MPHIRVNAPDDLAPAEANTKNNWPHEKRNFVGGLVHGTFFQLGLAFSQETTVLPAFVLALGGSNFLVGSILSLKRIGMIVPQLFFAHFLQSKNAKRPYLILAIYLRAAAWFVIGFITFTFAQNHTHWIIYAFIAFLTLFFLAGGVGEIVYGYLISHTIAPNHRGKFFGIRYLLAGASGMLAGFLSQSFFLNPDRAFAFPRNYASLFLLTAACLAIAGLGFIFMREPLKKSTQNFTPWKVFFMDAVAIVKQNPAFRRFIYVSMLVSGIYISLPFFVVFAQSQLRLPLSQLGLYISLQIFGETFSGLIWGWIGDKYGNRLALILVSLANVLAPVWAFTAAQLWTAGFGLTFMLAGIGFRGSDIVIRNYLLEISPSQAVPTWIALKNTLTAPTLLFPLLGSAWINLWGYHFIFLASAGIILIGGLLALSLPEPRHRKHELFLI